MFMMYWDDFTDKYGFSDGECYPPGIEMYREVYIKGFNAVLKKFGSSVRVIKYDRSGVHNFYMVVLCPKEDYERLAKYNGDIPTGEFIHLSTVPDDEYGEAIEYSQYDVDFDSFIETKTIVLHDELEDFIVNELGEE